MPKAHLQQKTDGKTRTVTFPKSEKLTPEPISLPTVVGYNLSEFSLSPLGRKTSHLASRRERYEWITALDDGTERECFFEKSYGDPAPNAYTEDVLLVLTHLAHNSTNPLSFRTSFYEIFKLQGGNYRPGDSQTRQATRHLDALCGMWIRTNFVYDLEDEEWVSVRTGVLAGYTYKDEKGKVRKRRVKTKRGEDDEEFVEVVQQERVFELKKVSFAPDFYEHFVRDTVPIDLATYFALEKPTAKRIYRFGNKYIQTLGHHSLDLQVFCVSRIGMSYEYVAAKRPSYLAAKIRPYTNRVNETGKIIVEVEKSNTPSGYKITFDRPVVQIPLISTGTSYTDAEHKAYQLLVKHGIYTNVARGIVAKYRNMLGREGARYIRFTVRQFQRDLVDSGKLKVPASGRPGVLKKAFDKNWYYSDFYEWQAKEEKRAWRDEHAKYPLIHVHQPSTPSAEPPVHPVGEVLVNTRAFSLDQFKEGYPDVYQRVVDVVTQRYDEFAEYGLPEARLEEMKRGSIEVHCKKCLEEFEEGNRDYFPPLLIEN